MLTAIRYSRVVSLFLTAREEEGDGQGGWALKSNLVPGVPGISL